jgi:hypothetical protein
VSRGLWTAEADGEPRRADRFQGEENEMMFQNTPDMQRARTRRRGVWLRSVLGVSAAFLLMSAVAGAAEGGKRPGEGLAGTQAVQFLVDDNFTLSAYQGQMFSYQRYLTDDKAIRLAAGLFLDYDDKELDVAFANGEEVGTADLSGWDHRGTVKLQMMFYRGRGPLRFFWGAGPRVSYTDNHTENVNFNSQGGDVEFAFYTYDSDIWELGLQGFSGVEWFINDIFSLHAEYSVTANYIIRDDVEHRIYSHDSDSNRAVETKTKSPQFDSDGVRFGLSAHF